MPPKRLKRVADAPAETSGPKRCTLADLPAELHLEIISYFPSIPFGLPGLNETDVRLNTLRALSQTCRILRKILEPLLWETLSVPRSWGSALRAKMLLKRCRGLAARDDLTKYVRFVPF